MINQNRIEHFGHYQGYNRGGDQNEVDKHTADVSNHYSRKSLSSLLLEALTQAGKDPDNLTRDDITGFEEFHIGGRESTRALAKLAKLTTGLKLLDVGSGIGGPARTLADEYGCDVTGLDLTEEYVDAAQMLTERVGLSDKARFVQGSALEMPFETDSFDIVWMQHVSMNIKDKRQLFSEIKRMLKPGGQLVFHEIMAGENGGNSDLHYPVFWASGPGLSFLSPPESIKDMLSDIGLDSVIWIETTRDSSAFFEKMLASVSAGDPPPLGLGILVGKDAPVKAKNVLKNLQENRLRVIQAVLSCSKS